MGTQTLWAGPTNSESTTCYSLNANPELFAEIREICSAEKTHGAKVGLDGTSCAITNGRVSMTVELDVLSGELSVREWDHPVNLPGDPIAGFHFQRDERSEARFLPDRPSDCDFGWREKARTAKPFLTVAELAERCVSQFMALVQLDENGQINHEWMGNSHQSRF